MAWMSNVRGVLSRARSLLPQRDRTANRERSATPGRGRSRWAPAMRIRAVRGGLIPALVPVVATSRPVPSRRLESGHRGAIWWSTLTAGALAACVLAVQGGHALGSAAASAADDPGTSACVVEPAKTADPSLLELGEAARITLDLESVCPEKAAPIDVVLVMDQSASMLDDDKLTNAKTAAYAFLEEMDFEQSRVALIAFNHVAGMRLGLTDDKARLRSEVGSLIASGQTNISSAIELASDHLEEAGDPERTRAMIVLTDGFNTVPADPVPVAAQSAKDLGIIVATICTGGDCDTELPAAASEPALHFDVPDSAELAELYRTLAEKLQKNAIVSLTIVDVLPANMRFIPGSSVPEPDAVAHDVATGETTLTWVLTGGMPEGGISYSVEPLELGVHPTNVVATGDFVDRKGLPGRTEFPVPIVEVIAPPCLPRALEVYFLIDDSTCLFNTRLSGMDALEAIAEGVDRSLDQMSLGRDTAAIIGFGDTAELFQPLTTDREALLDAVMRVAMRDMSARLDLAYDEVRSEMRSPRHNPRAQVVTVTITDGPMMAAPERSSARAEFLRREGVLHYIIAVGPIVQHSILRPIAEPDGYRHIALGGDAIGEYETLAALYGPLGGVCVPIGEPTPTVPIVTPTPDPAVSPTPSGFGWRSFLPRLSSTDTR